MEKVKEIINVLITLIVAIVLVSFELPLKIIMFTLSWALYILAVMFAPLVAKINFSKKTLAIIEYGMKLNLPITLKVINAYVKVLF
jgi:hypothetical protein